MTEEDLCYAPATELLELIRTKRLSPVDLTRTVLRRIEALEPKLNAIVTLTADKAMDEARAAERALMRGDARGALTGIPVTIKDLTDVAGVPTERGTNILRNAARATTDAPIVTRLREAGAVILGKTTTPEFAWSGVSNSPLTGITHNPWKHGYNAGASSAGAGVGAAAGYGPLHQGSDGAGSIRMPAHFCGVFGLKPTFGRVPYAPVPNNDYCSHIGPMTRTVADAALMLRVMAGAHPLDHTSLEAPPADYPAFLRAGVRGKRVALSMDLGHAQVDPEVRDLVYKAAYAFTRDLGAEVEEVEPGWGPDGAEMIRVFWPAHQTGRAKYLADWEPKMDPALVACIRAGLTVTMEQYQLTRDRKLAYVHAMQGWFEDWDFLLTPTVSVAAFPADRIQPEHWPEHPWDWLSWAEFSYPFNLSGNPAATVPCGFTRDGLPVGLQIVGRRFDDLGVLQAAAAFEGAHPWAQHRPPM